LTEGRNLPGTTLKPSFAMLLPQIYCEPQINTIANILGADIQMDIKLHLILYPAAVIWCNLRLSEI
jgi:hypothetical protein